MNLIIDIGNTNVKLAVFQRKELLEKRVVAIDNLSEELNLILEKFKKINKGIISSVGRLESSILEYIEKRIKLLILTSETKIPFKNQYETPKTLGVDRIALVSAAIDKYPNKNVLIIDAGTCITFDFVTKKSIYLGGAISPGIYLRYQSLNNLTANLPLLSLKNPKNMIGNSTEESIHSGVVNGVIAEIKGIVKEYKKEHKDLTIILTGGDVDFLSKRLKNTIFANSIFLLEGLNYILEFNSIK